MNLGSLIKGKGCLVLFLIPFICMGLIGLFYSINKMYEGYTCRDWGRIIANVEKVDFVIKKSSGRNSGTSYLVNVKYNYLINNKKYSSDRVSFGYGANNTDNHHQIFDVLKGAKRIVVYVNPEDSAEAVVVPGINNSIMGIFIATIMWNSLVIVLSVLFLGNIKTDNKWLGIVLISFVGLIWAIGFGILTTKSFNVQIEKKIEVVEKI